MVHRTLTNSGFRVVSVRPDKSGRRSLYRALPTFFKVGTSDLVLFSRQLSTFIRVGVPITDAIKLLQGSSNSGPFKVALEEICEDLDAGESLSVAMSHHPNVFNELYIDMVRAAEYSGTLDRVLGQVAAHFQRQDSAIKKLRSAMIYPAVVLILAVSVCTILVTFVLPNFISIFNEFHAELPWPTRLMLAIGTFAQAWRLQILIGMGLTILAGIAFFSSKPGRIFWDHTVLRLPVLGNIVSYSIIERFARTLSTMLRAGISINQTFDIAISATGNDRFKKGLESVKQRMVTGDGFSQPLAATGLFAPMMIRMIRVGEETGTLDNSLEQIADFLTEEIDYKVRNMITLIEPTMVVAVGAMVGFVAISVVLPMYGLLKAVH